MCYSKEAENSEWKIGMNTAYSELDSPIKDAPRHALGSAFAVAILMSGQGVFANGAGSSLQIATVVAFVVTVGAGFMFWRDLPDFKLSMQAFMQSQKHWKCRDCNNEWEI